MSDSMSAIFFIKGHNFMKKLNFKWLVKCCKLLVPLIYYHCNHLVKCNFLFLLQQISFSLFTVMFFLKIFIVWGIWSLINTFKIAMVYYNRTQVGKLSFWFHAHFTVKALPIKMDPPLSLFSFLITSYFRSIFTWVPRVIYIWHIVLIYITALRKLTNKTCASLSWKNQNQLWLAQTCFPTLFVGYMYLLQVLINPLDFLGP